MIFLLNIIEIVPSEDRCAARVENGEVQLSRHINNLPDPG